MRLDVMPGRYAICRLAPDAPLPPILLGSALVSVTLTPNEVSLVCPDDDAPPDAVVDGGWRALRVAGPLDLTLTGVLASLAQPLAHAGLSLFAVSTYDTDYLLVRESTLTQALDALRAAGHEVSAG